MQIIVDTSKGLPIYLQIVEQIKHQIANGMLKIGDKLPTVRQLAVDLAVNPNTVAKSYTELERSGFLATKQGIGTFVKKSEDPVTRNERADKIRRITSKFIDDARLHGYSLEEIEVWFKVVMQERKK